MLVTTTPDPKAFRWTCPHCGGGPMKLVSAKRHILRKHNACWSCSLESMLLDAMLTGTGKMFVSPDGVPTMFTW